MCANTVLATGQFLNWLHLGFRYRALLRTFSTPLAQLLRTQHQRYESTNFKRLRLPPENIDSDSNSDSGLTKVIPPEKEQHDAAIFFISILIAYERVIWQYSTRLR